MTPHNPPASKQHVNELDAMSTGQAPHCTSYLGTFDLSHGLLVIPSPFLFGTTAAPGIPSRESVAPFSQGKQDNSPDTPYLQSVAPFDRPTLLRSPAGTILRVLPPGDGTLPCLNPRQGSDLRPYLGCYRGCLASLPGRDHTLV